MLTINNGGGLRLRVSGAPSLETVKLKEPEHVGSIPFSIPFIKPKLVKAEGDHVNIGTPLFYDKNNPELQFVSPGCGTISDIVFGPRRVIEKIIIHLDKSETSETFDPIDKNALKAITRKDLTERLLNGGVWPFIRELPFRGIADPDTRPSSIWVTLDTREPFMPSPDIYLQGKTNQFELGLDILKKYSDNINVSAGDGIHGHVPVTHTCPGSYPSGDPGVLLYHTKQTPDENRSWYIAGQDLLLLSSFLTKGSYPVERVVAVGGSKADKEERRHCITRIGAPIANLLPASSKKPGLRYLTGGLFRGSPVPPDSFLGLYDTSLNVIDQGDREEFLGFIRPGFAKPSASRTFLSSIHSKKLELDTGTHGEIRACVNCGSCAKICPVHILPQFMFKCIVANEIEEALAHGLLDCVECGLCTYVCPSKIELNDTFRKTKREYRNEQY